MIFFFLVTNGCPVIQEDNPPVHSPSLTTITLKVPQTQAKWMPLFVTVIC